jgi:hypothetical protein
MHKRLHMYRTLYMKCTVLLVFSLSFHCRNMYFWYISHVHKNTYVPYFIHEMHYFASVFMCFHLVFTAETCSFGTFYMYTIIHLNRTLHIKFTVLLLFSLSFLLQKHVYLWSISYVHKNAHVQNFIHKMHCFTSVFVCFN